MEKIEKSFKDCTLKFLEKTFDLEEVDTLPALSDWLDTKIILSDFQNQSLLHLRQVLDFNVYDWNEYELDSHFIGPMFTLVNFSSKKSTITPNVLSKALLAIMNFLVSPTVLFRLGDENPKFLILLFKNIKEN